MRSLLRRRQQVSPAWGSLAITLCVLAVLTLLDSSPPLAVDPDAVLLTIVVFAAFVGGLRAGLASTVLVIAYAALFYARFLGDNTELLQFGVVVLITPFIAL